MPVGSCWIRVHPLACQRMRESFARSIFPAVRSPRHRGALAAALEGQSRGGQEDARTVQPLERRGLTRGVGPPVPRLLTEQGVLAVLGLLVVSLGDRGFEGGKSRHPGKLTDRRGEDRSAKSRDDGRLDAQRPFPHRYGLESSPFQRFDFVGDEPALGPHGQDDAPFGSDPRLGMATGAVGARRSPTHPPRTPPHGPRPGLEERLDGHARLACRLGLHHALVEEGRYTDGSSAFAVR